VPEHRPFVFITFIFGLNLWEFHFMANWQSFEKIKIKKKLRFRVLLSWLRNSFGTCLMPEHRPLAV